MQIDRPLYIQASGGVLLPYPHVDTGSADEPLLPLKQLVLEKSGGSPRRVGRFIQLVLVGAGDCIGGQQLPEDTAVYLASENGDMEVSVAVLESMYTQQQPPKPLSFINTVSNAACFYLGNAFGLRGESNFISSTRSAFEKNLFMAAVDLLSHASPLALAGAVEMLTLPIHQYAQRVNTEISSALAELSSWLLLSPEKTPDTLATISSMELCSSVAELKLDHSHGDYRGNLLLGQSLSAVDRSMIEQQVPLASALTDVCLGEKKYKGPGLIAWQVHAFLHQCDAQELILINQGLDACYSFIKIEKQK